MQLYADRHGNRDYSLQLIFYPTVGSGGEIEGAGTVLITQANGEEPDTEKTRQAGTVCIEWFKSCSIK